MKHLFGFNNYNTWKNKFHAIYYFYLKNKNNKEISPLDIDVSIDDNSASISQRLDNSIGFFKRDTGEYEVIDFSQIDYKNPKSKKGVYTITKNIYDEYVKKIQEISDWLDERSESSFNISDVEINSIGEININSLDLLLDEISDKVKSELKIIGKEFEFELSYHSRISNSSNKLIIERKKLKINDLEFGFGGGRFWCQLFTTGAYGEKTALWIESNSSHEYVDFEKEGWPYDRKEIIRMVVIKQEMNRKQQREFEKNRKYPYTISYDTTPSEWSSMEMIKDLTFILKELNKNKI